MCLERSSHFGAHQTLGLIKHDGNTNNGGRELILNANTTENKIELQRTWPGCQKR